MNSQSKLDLEGKLDVHPLAELLVEISQSGLSGALRIENDGRKIAVYFEDGDLVYAASNARKHKLFEILLRTKIIAPEKLSAINDFVNDLKLKEHLTAHNLVSTEKITDAFKQQFSMILQEALVWRAGIWIFTPLARIKDEMRQVFDFYPLLFEYGRGFSGTQSAQRLKSFQETFRLHTSPPKFNLLPQEAFLLSRFRDQQLTVDDLRHLSGMPESETFRILYALWLGGFLKRENWNAAFSDEKLKNINSAKLMLKTLAPEAEKPEEKVKAVTPKPEIIEEKAEKQNELTLENYLVQIESAENFYQILGVSPTDSVSEIKKSYFALAKRFHPDLFYRQVEAEQHKQVQQAFTEIAQAYETLRNEETREVYDYKMRKNIEYKTQKLQPDGSVIDDADGENQSRAAQIFETGFSLLMDENFRDALPYLARAVNLVDDNAKYHAYYGRALSENDKKHQAEAEFQTAIKLDPENTDFRLMLIRLFIDIGLARRAEGEIKRLLEIAPDNYEAKALLEKVKK